MILLPKNKKLSNYHLIMRVLVFFSLLLLMIFSLVSCKKANNDLSKEEEGKHIITIGIKISGMPDKATTTLHFYNVDLGKEIARIENVTNDKTSAPCALSNGKYIIYVYNVYLDNKKLHLKATPVTFNVKSDTLNSDINISFISDNSLVSGWPEYIAMGAVTNADYSNKNTFANRPVDAIFKYDGDGAGDKGKVFLPISVIFTNIQARDLSKDFNRKVLPVIVIYMAQMSFSVTIEDFLNENNALTKHFINLMLSAAIFEFFKTSDNQFPGSIILNPDLMGEVQKHELWELDPLREKHSEHAEKLKTLKITVNRALSQAAWFINTPRNWRFTEGSATLDVKNITIVDLVKNIINGQYPDFRISSLWEFSSQYNNMADSILQNAPTNYKGIDIPKFRDDFNGWIQANNWVIRQFAPSVTFGWQSNVWSNDSAHWVHRLSDDDVIKKEVTPIANLWNNLEIYKGPYRPDFVVFDKWEMDSSSSIGDGWFWNQNALDKYVLFAKSIGERLDNIPVMIWQLPGSHLQTTNPVDVDTRVDKFGTEPDYVFGDINLENDLSNVGKHILNQKLSNLDLYKTTDMHLYLTRDNQDWKKDHLDKIADAKVFAILWGGGQTTSVGTFGGNDNGWLSNKIKEYYKHPKYHKK